MKQSKPNSKEFDLDTNEINNSNGANTADSKSLEPVILKSKKKKAP
ncbi:MAG: hypothetical protein IPP72_18500 [Chitinophagaceae bacterium]|nr:hypothetical protein [Chitinophagaceae bacterium]